MNILILSRAHRVLLNKNAVLAPDFNLLYQWLARQTFLIFSVQILYFLNEHGLYVVELALLQVKSIVQIS